MIQRVGRFAGSFIRESSFSESGIANGRRVIIDPENKLFSDKGRRQGIYRGLLFGFSVHVSDCSKIK